MFNKIRKIILDILFPIECLGCGKDDVWLCDECLEKLPVNKGVLRLIDLKPLYLNGFFIASDWEDKILQEAIHKFKYNFIRELSEPLSKLMIKKSTELIYELIHEFQPEDDQKKNLVIIPVPLHKKRYIWRGFNQAELLSEKIAKEFNLKLDNKLLKRIKNTSPQVKLSGKQRGENIIGAFSVGSTFTRGAEMLRHHTMAPGMNLEPTYGMAGKNYLLIDDVITTGATMNECAKVLKQNGAIKVYGLALARG